MGSALNSYVSGSHSKAMSRVNANYSEIAAFDARNQGKTELIALRKQAGAHMGGQAAGIAASGIQLGEGNAARIIGQSAENAEFAAISIQNAARRKAWGLNEQAKIQRFEGKLAYRAGVIGSVSSVMSMGMQGGLGGGGA